MGTGGEEKNAPRGAMWGPPRQNVSRSPCPGIPDASQHVPAEQCRQQMREPAEDQHAHAIGKYCLWGQVGNMDAPPGQEDRTPLVTGSLPRGGAARRACVRVCVCVKMRGVRREWRGRRERKREGVRAVAVRSARAMSVAAHASAWFEPGPICIEIGAAGAACGARRRVRV